VARHRRDAVWDDVRVDGVDAMPRHLDAVAAPAASTRAHAGWLVLEKWIKPSLFSVWDAFDKKAPKDQWTYCETLGKTECKRRLEQHWCGAASAEKTSFPASRASMA
jgi:hypothetical protein